jgi:predicted metal-binding membrane protein
MAILLAAGMMDLAAMAIVTAAITIERFVPWPRHAARAIGVLAIAVGIAKLLP